MHAIEIESANDSLTKKCINYVTVFFSLRPTFREANEIKVYRVDGRFACALNRKDSTQGFLFRARIQFFRCNTSSLRSCVDLQPMQCFAQRD